MGRGASAAILAVALLVAGCGAGGAPATATPTRVPATPAPTVEPSHLYDPNADARADVKAALAMARIDGKRVLLDIGADWCPDCHSLAADMEGTAGRALIEPAFHVVRIDVGMFDHNLDVVSQYVQLVGIPTVVVLEPNGAMVGASTGTSSLANARVMTEEQVLAELAAWVK